jgi:hypothetical protein
MVYYSSPAVADGRLYVGSDGGHTVHAYALDPWLQGRLLSLEEAGRALPPDPAELIPDYRLEPQWEAQQEEAQVEGETDALEEPDPAR